MDKDESFYKILFYEICNGYSESFFGGHHCYIKHLNLQDYCKFNMKENAYLDKAIKRGIPQEKDVLQNAIDQGDWSKEEDSEVDAIELYLDNLKQTKKNLIIQAEKDLHQKMIDEELLKLKILKSKKDSLLMNTAEKYAAKQLNDFFIQKTFFKDENLKNFLYTSDEFDELSHGEISNLVKEFNSFHKKYSEDNIKNCVLQAFFNPYMFITNDAIDFFGKPAIQLTNHQISIMTYSRIFKNIFENVPDIPEAIKQDPDALLDFASSSKERSKLKDNLEKDGASTVFGATKEDYKNMGVDNKMAKAQSIHEAARKKGGTLNMEDLMKMT